MKPTKNVRRLQLSRESVRPLDSGSLQAVHGGGLSGVISGTETKVCDPGFPPTQARRPQ